MLVRKQNLTTIPMRRLLPLVRFSCSKPLVILILAAFGSLVGAWLVRDLQPVSSPKAMLSWSPRANETGMLEQQAFSLQEPLILGVSNTTHERGVLNGATLEKVRILGTSLREAFPDDLTVVLGPGTDSLIVADGLGKIRFSPMVAGAPGSDAAVPLPDSLHDQPLADKLIVADDGTALAVRFTISDPAVLPRIIRALQEQAGQLPAGQDRFFLAGYPLGRHGQQNALARTFVIALLIGLGVSSAAGALLTRKPLAALGPAVAALPAVILPLVLAALLPFPASPPILAAPLGALLLVQLAGWLLTFSLQSDPDRPAAAKEAALDTWNDNLPLLATLLLSSLGLAACLALLPPASFRYTALLLVPGLLFACCCCLTILPAWNVLPIQPERGAACPISGRGLPAPIRRLIESAAGRPAPWMASLILLLLLGGIGCMLLTLDDQPPLHGIPLGDSVDHERQEWILNQSREAGVVLTRESTAPAGSEAGKWLFEQVVPNLAASPSIQEQAMDDLAQIEESALDAATADTLQRKWANRLAGLPLEDTLGHDLWSRAIEYLERLTAEQQIFIRPEMVAYIEDLQKHLDANTIVSHSLSIAALIRKVHQELFEGSASYHRIPDTAAGVRQALDRLGTAPPLLRAADHIRAGYDSSLIRVYLKEDSRRALKILQADLNEFILHNPPPVPVQHSWLGLPMDNSAWQDRLSPFLPLLMPLAMLVPALAAFLLFRSWPWALLGWCWSLIPPVAVLGTCGLAGQPLTAVKLSILPLLLSASLFLSILGSQHLRLLKIRQKELDSGELISRTAPLVFQVALLSALSFLPGAILTPAPLNRAFGLLTILLPASSLFFVFGIGTGVRPLARYLYSSQALRPQRTPQRPADETLGSVAETQPIDETSGSDDKPTSAQENRHDHN